MKGRSLPIDGFLVAIFLAVATAAIAPRLGARGGILHVDVLAGIAVTLVFFLHGALLPLESLRRGFRNTRLHLISQGTTYLVFPVIGATLLWLPIPLLPKAVAVGFFFMSTVSSTISSSVAMTAIAGGDVAGSLFNATLSGVLGVFVTPAYASLAAHSAGFSLPLSAVIEAVSLKVLLPLMLGQLLRPLLLARLERHRRWVQWIDRGSIVLIVFGAFCDSVLAGAWSRSALVPVLIAVLVAAVVLALVSGVLIVLIQAARLDRQSAIAAYFCGSQKSLANGLPIAQAVFAGSSHMGLIVMPLLVYHQIQLAVGAIVARRFAQRGAHD